MCWAGGSLERVRCVRSSELRLKFAKIIRGWLTVAGCPRVDDCWACTRWVATSGKPLAFQFAMDAPVKIRG